MNATATPAETLYSVKNGKAHRATCARLKGEADSLTATEVLAVTTDAATCCKPERSAEWKFVAARLERQNYGQRPTLTAVPDAAPAGVDAELGAELDAATEKAAAKLEPTPATEHGVLNSDRFDTTERKVTLRHDGATFAALYVRRAYRKDATKPYSGTWLLESNGAMIEGGPSVGYRVNGTDAGKGPLGAVAAIAATHAKMG